MFKDEQTQNIIHANLNDTVIRATHRTQDLIPAFLDVIKDTPEYVQVLPNIPAYAMDDTRSEWWDSEEAVYLLEELFDTINAYAPEGYYFGAHPGDGSDFGFWVEEKYEKNFDEFFNTLKKDYIENDVCMTEFLASTPADGLTLEAAFEMYIAARRWADKDKFCVEIEGEIIEL